MYVQLTGRTALVTGASASVNACALKALFFAGVVVSAALAYGQATAADAGPSYPSKPIRIMTSGAGGASDLPSRLISQGVSGTLGQPVIVDNRGGVAAIGTVAQATPDGYTLVLYGSSIWLLPLMQNVAWDPVKSFAPITLAVSSPNILVVHPSLPVKSVKELIAWAKARPGELNYASGTTGSPPHLATELFKSMAGVDLVRVAYKGGPQSMTGLFGGEVQVYFSTMTSAAPHLTSSRLRALAVTSAEPSPLVPGLPTIAASGLPGYEAVGVYGILAPAKTPEAIISLLHQEIVRALNKADAKEKLSSVGVTAVGSTPKELAAFIKSEMGTMGKVIKDAGIRAD